MNIGFQLYSARNFPLADVLKRIAELGYTHVEGYGALYTDPVALKAQLDTYGLKMPTAHINLADLEDAEATLKLADTLGIQVVICPWVSPEARGADASSWRSFGARLEKISQPYRAAGLLFAYHNHDFEFATFDGRFGMDLLLEEAPSVSMEADVAWIARAGVDPAGWLETWGKRIVAVHVKDIAPAGTADDEGGWADAGQGVVPWTSLMPLIKSKTEARYFIAEHDNPKDVERFASRSIAFIKSLEA